MKLDIDTFLTYLALFSGAGASVIVGFNVLMYGLSHGEDDPHPYEMLTALMLFTTCIFSLLMKAIIGE